MAKSDDETQDSGYDGAGEVSLRIAGHARFGVGTAAPSLKGLQALAKRHGTSAEYHLPGLVCTCGVGDLEVCDAVTAGARMLLAPLGGVDPDESLPVSTREHVYKNADAVLSWLNRLGERIVSGDTVAPSRKKKGAH